MYWESYNVAKIRGKYLYRFMSKERLEQFLNSGNLWFSRADLFGDKMECFRLSDISGKSFDYDSILSRKKKHLICCFHEGNNESLAMWDTYFRKDKDRRNFLLWHANAFIGNRKNIVSFPFDLLFFSAKKYYTFGRELYSIYKNIGQ